MLAKFNTLKNHAGFIRYIKNTSWMMAEQLLRMLAGLFVGIWVARYLGPEQFGLFGYVLAFTAIFSGIAKLGLDGILVRELVNNPENKDVYLGTAFWLKVVGAFIVIGLMAAIVPFTSNDATTNIFIFIIALGMVFQSFEVVEFYFQSQVLAKVVSICKVIQLSLSSVIKIYLVLIEGELIWFVLVTAFDALGLAISYSIAYHVNKGPVFYKRFDLSIAKQLLNDSWPLMFAALGFTLFSNVDAVMIKEMLNEASVGIYMAAYKLTVIWYFLPGLVLNSVMPAIVRVKDDQKEYTKRTQIITGLLVWFAIILALVVTLLSKQIIVYSFGEKYIDSIDLLVILIWINVIIFFNSCWNRWHVVKNQTKFVLYFHFLTAISNIIFNLILITFFGLIGAAYSILVSLTLSLLVFSFIDKDTIHLMLRSLTFGRYSIERNA